MSQPPVQTRDLRQREGLPQHAAVVYEATEGMVSGRSTTKVTLMRMGAGVTPWAAAV